MGHVYLISKLSLKMLEKHRNTLKIKKYLTQITKLGCYMKCKFLINKAIAYNSFKVLSS